MLLTVKDIARRLDEHARTLAQELLPAGRLIDGRWCVGDIQNTPAEKSGSLKLDLTGDKRGYWHDFATGESGDMLDLVAIRRCGGDIKAAVRWAKDYLGIDEHDLKARTDQARARIARAEAQAEAEKVPPRDDEKRKRAVALWLAAEPHIRGTPVHRYLRGRGIDLSKVGSQPAALRYAPACYHGPTARRFPAMVARVVDASGVHVSTHRTFLQEHDDGRVTKADLGEQAKMVLGGYRGGMIRIANGDPTGPHGHEVVITEGIEDALTLMRVFPAHRIVTSIAVTNMGNLLFPPEITSVVLALDNDPVKAGRAKTDKAVNKAYWQHKGRKLAVRTLLPPADAKDFNEWIERTIRGR